MQEDVFPAAEKILSDIENVFKRDLNLMSFGIFPAEDNENKSPVLHDENSLGLASWCIQPLYCYVYNRLLDLRENHQREEPTVVLRWLLGALLLNPDVSTFWNMRREFVRNGRLDPLEELRIVNIVLYDKSKCFEAFSYRRWILKLLLVDGKEVINDAESLFRNEMRVTSMAAERYGNNCHAWSHREHIISMFESLFSDKFDNFLNNEWEESTKWCNNHISDYSGFSYRQFLLKKLLVRKQHFEQSISTSEILTRRREIIFEFVKGTKNSSNTFFLHDGSSEEILNVLHKVNTKKCLELNFDQTLINLSYWAEDCLFNEELINTFPGHEALWYHRRFLVYSLLALHNSYINFNFYTSESLNPFKNLELFNNKNKSSSCTSLTESLSQSLLKSVFCSRNKELIDAAKHQGSYQNHLAEKFFKFLGCMELEP